MFIDPDADPRVDPRPTSPPVPTPTVTSTAPPPTPTWSPRPGTYARHNGHADLLRERIDGRVGQ